MSQKKFTLRRAEEKDLDILVDFNNRIALESEGHPLDLAVLRSSMKHILEDERKGIYWLACDGEKVIGQMMYVFEWSTWQDKNYMWLTDLYVLPEYRRQGVFKLLNQHLLDFYQKSPDIIGVRFYVAKTNTAVVPLYRRIGWKESKYNLWEVTKNDVR